MVPFRKLQSNGRLKQDVGKVGSGSLGDQEKHEKLVKGNHRDRRHGNPSTREPGRRALEGRKSARRISCLVSVTVFREGCMSAECVCEK